MNKNTYKLKFDRQQGKLVAVSEITTANGKCIGQSTISSPIKPSTGVYFILKQIVAILLTAALPLTAHAQIINDANQTGSKPIVTVAGNGVPIINIVAPNSNGVSLNQFNQYNVDSKGAILNNSGGMSNTQLAGYIPANPMLGNASASTIINQVTGPDTSSLNGMQEIAGHKANLVIANPNGISVNGGGFINAGKVILTTGTPQLTNGALTGVNVSTGNIAVNGDGLNASHLDKLTLITRAAQLNAQIWADKAEMILGANQVALDEQGNTSHISSQAVTGTGTGTTPTFALDVAQLGGMYANQMRIIGTEAGLGVNNGGKLISETPLTLDANGNLTNTGHINGGNDSSIKVTSVNNSGDITTVNNLQLASTGTVTNSGSITAGSVQLDAASLANSGSITQTGAQKLDLAANTLTNTGRIGIADQTVNPAEPAPTASSNTNAPSTSTANNVEGATPTNTVATDPVVLKDGHINITGQANNSGVIDAGAAIHINSQTLTNSGKVQTAGALNVNSTAINNQGGTLKSQTSTVITSNTLDNSNAGLIQAPSLTITAHTIDNSNSGNTGGIVGENTLTLNADGQIDNSAGYIAGGQLTLNTPKLINTKGSIVTGSDLTLDNATLDNQQGTIGAKNLTLNNQTLNNQGGALTAGQHIAVNAGNLNNQDGGLIQAQHINLKADNLDNRNSGDTGGIIGTTDLTIDATQINNGTGYIAGQTAIINANTLNNTSGSIASGTTLKLSSAQLTNQQGLISAQGSASINSTTIDNQQGTLTADNLNIQSTTFNNQGGTAIAGQALNLNTSTLNNQDTGLVQGQTAHITADNIVNTNSGNTGGIIGIATLQLNATQTIDNSTGYIAGGQTSINAPTLTNATGSIIANSLDLTSTDVNNSAGRITAYTTNAITASTLNNQSGLVQAGTTATLNIANIDNRNTTQDLTSAAATDNPLGIQASTLNISGKHVDNSNGQIIASTVTSTGQTLNNQNGQVIADNASISTSEQLDNSNGQLIAEHTLALDTPNLLNTNGKVHSNDTLNLAIHGNYTSAGQITSANNLNLAVDNDFTHSNTANLNAAGKLAINAANITNQSGATLNAGHTALTASGTITNDGTIDGNLVELRANTIENHSKIYGGTTDGQGGIVIGADTINNNPNAVIASRGNMAIGTRILNNEKGALIQSLGDFAIGRTLNTDYSISGQAEQLNNKSATIEVGRDVTQWDVAQTLNQNTDFQTSLSTSSSTGSVVTINGQVYNNNDLQLVFINSKPQVNTNFPVVVGNINQMTQNTLGEDTGWQIILPSSQYPLSTFTAPYSNLTKVNPQNQVLATDGNSPLTPVHPTQATADGYSSDYTIGELGTIAPSSRKMELISQAYYPEQTYESQKAGSMVNLAESYTYAPTDAVWGAFNITPPSSPAPALPQPPASFLSKDSNGKPIPASSIVACTSATVACSAYNQQAAVYQTWVSQNKPLYVQLNKAINAFNVDTANRTIWTWQWFNGSINSQTPIVVQSTPALIKVAGNMALSGQISNDKSQIVVGGALTGNVDGITNQGATLDETTSYSGNEYSTTMRNRSHYFRQYGDPTTANLAPQVQTIVLGVGQTQINAGNQALNGKAEAQSTNSGSVAVNNATGVDTTAHDTGSANSTPITSIPTGNNTEVRTVAFNGILPSNVLFTQHGDAAAQYLIETDPSFTNKQAFLSSDYMLAQLSTDPNTAWKRLGDGFYEQQLIDKQIITATGKRFIGDYSSSQDQYKALMNNGLTFGKQFGLNIGNALTPEQMRNLTTDLVWMVKETVTLKDGTQQTVLVPKVYLATKVTDITGDGTLISAKHNWLDVGKRMTIDELNARIAAGETFNADEITIKDGMAYFDGRITNNGGTIAGTSSMDITANNIDNRGGFIGGNSGGTVNLRATDSINNIGGAIRGGTVALSANNINVQTTTRTTSAGNFDSSQGHASTRTAIDQVASISALDASNPNNPAPSLIINATQDVNLQGALISSQGSALIHGGNINASTVSTGFAEKANLGNHWSFSNANSSEVGSNIQTQGNLTVVADKDLNGKAVTINSEAGTVTLAGNNVNLTEGRQTLDYMNETYQKSHGFLSSSSTHQIDSVSLNSSVGSQVTGDKVVIQAGHDANIRASTVVSDSGTTIAAGNNVTIESGVDTYHSDSSTQTKKSGFTAGYSAGVASIGYGKSSNASQNSTSSTTQAASTIASLTGNTTVQAGNHLQVTASDLAAGQNLTLIAKDIDLEAAQDTSTSNSAQQSKSSGFSIGLTVNPIAAYQAARNNATGNMPSTGSTMNTIGRTAEGIAAGTRAATTAVVIQAGSKSSSGAQDHATSTAHTSSLTAGNNLTMIATDGSIDSQGTQMSAEGNALILAKDNINFDVAHNVESSDSKSKASGWSIANTTTGLPFGVFKNKANGNGSTDTITGTQLSVGGTTSLATTEGDINLTASNIAGQGDVNINAARNLTIQSGQDTVANENHSNNKAIGTVVISDTERFIGYHAEKHNDTKDQVTQVSSNVASLGGNVNLKAGEKYTQVASNVMAANDIDITAKSLDILTADNTGTQHVDDKSLKIGVFARVQSPLIDLVNNVDAARQSDGRLKGLQNMAAAANGVQALAGAAGQTGYLVRAEAGIGVASAQSRNDATYSTSQSSAINGGHNVNLTSTEGDIHTVAANIGAGQTLSLDSARDILLESGQSTSTSSGKNSNYGVEIGIGAEIGQKTGAYIYGQAQFGKGKYNTESISQTNTHLQAQTLNISSNGNTTLHGADAQADTINADVGGKLLIESVQDTAEQHSKESGGKVRVTYGTNGLNGELNYNQTKANGSYEGVNQQSGLFAGQGGYHVQSDSTELIGGALTSTNPTRSELTTGALSFKDIENKSTYATSSTGINLSTRSSMAGNIVNNLGNIVNMVGSGKPTEEASITKATLTEGNINIGGQQTSAASTGINTDDNTAHKALENLPDLRALMAEQQAEAAAISTISQGVTIVVNNAISYGQGVAIDKLKQADQALLDAQTSGDSTVIKTAEQNKAAAVSNVNHWGKDGLYTIAANAVGQVAIGLAADKDPKAIAAAIAAPMVANAIGDRIGTNNPAAKFAAHAVTAGIVAALNGADTKEALAAGLATGLTEAVIIPAVSDALFGTHDPMLLTSDQKQELLAISGVSGAIVAGLVGDSATAAGFGVSGSLNAVANNYLKAHEIEDKRRRLAAAKTQAERDAINSEYQQTSLNRNAEFAEACKTSGSTCNTWLDQAATDAVALQQAYINEPNGLTKRQYEGELKRLSNQYMTAVETVTGQGSIAGVFASGQLTDAQKGMYYTMSSSQGKAVGETVYAFGAAAPKGALGTPKTLLGNVTTKNGGLVGQTRNGGGLGTPREMPVSANPSATAEAFATNAMGGVKPLVVKPVKDGGWSAKYADGTAITYRPAGQAGNRTDAGTASVDIKNNSISTLNDGATTLKLKFPQK